MKTFNVAGNDYPFKMDNMAWENWEDSTGLSVYDFDVTSLKQSCQMLFYGLQRGSKKSGIEFDLTYEQFRDSIDEMLPGEILEKCIDLSGQFDKVEEEISKSLQTEEDGKK